jgi:enoyl-CoA hydratase/carnithine racemase
MTAPRFENVKYEVEGGVATITLNRPERLNASGPDMRGDIIAALDLSDADDAVRAVIFTGAGRAFCAGADLSAGGARFNPDQQGAVGQVPDEEHRDGGGILALRIYRSLKPVISAVNGAAVGVGVTMQLPMDIRLASTEARFGFVFARRGIVPEAASSWFLPRLVGPQTALEWCFTGRMVSAQEALDRGLVRSVHAPDDLLPAARALGREIAENTSAVSVALTRQMLWRMLSKAHPMDAHRVDSLAMRQRGRMGDPKEGVESFLEKRPPRFPDRVSNGLPNPWRDWVEPAF